jgi:hypothetical protein
LIFTFPPVALVYPVAAGILCAVSTPVLVRGISYGQE